MGENSAPTPYLSPLLSGPTWAIRMLARAIEIVADRTLDADDALVVRGLCDEAVEATNATLEIDPQPLIALHHLAAAKLPAAEAKEGLVALSHVIDALDGGGDRRSLGRLLEQIGPTGPPE